MKILLDQCIPRGAAAALRDAGFDAVHVAECDLSTAPDSLILSVARQQQRIIISLDSDFHMLLASENATAPSVIRIRQEGLRAKAAAVLIRSVLDTCKDDLLHGAMISATQKQVRIRLLPLSQHA
jgi:predicted nuclease of predicted toxin-antitoxin system